MLMAVNDFVADSLGATGNIGNLEFGANSIVIEKGENCYMVSMNYGEPSDSLRQGLRKQIELIEEIYTDKLEKWDGYIECGGDTGRPGGRDYRYRQYDWESRSIPLSCRCGGHLAIRTRGRGNIQVGGGVTAIQNER